MVCHQSATGQYNTFSGLWFYTCQYRLGICTETILGNQVRQPTCAWFKNILEDYSQCYCQYLRYFMVYLTDCAVRIYLYLQVFWKIFMSLYTGGIIIVPCIMLRIKVFTVASCHSRSIGILNTYIISLQDISKTSCF